MCEVKDIWPCHSFVFTERIYRLLPTDTKHGCIISDRFCVFTMCVGQSGQVTAFRKHRSLIL